MQFFRLISFCLFVSILPSLAFGLTFQELPGQNQLRITEGDFQATFGNASYGFSVNNIKHLGHAANFGKSPDSAQNSFLWKLELTNDGGVSSFVTLTNLSLCDKSYSFDGVNGLVLNFINLDVPGGNNTVDITVTIKASDIADMTAWRISVDNRSSYALWKIRFPVVAFGKIDGDPNSIVLNQSQEGRYINDVTNHGWSGWAEPAGIFYPSDRGQMQWSAYYKGDGGTNYYPPAAKGPGLYLATHDAHPVAAKKYSYTPDSSNNRWIYNCTLFPEDIRNGMDYTMSYDHIVGLFDGYWYEAAAIYRDWVKDQHWVRKGKLFERTDQPEWFKNITYCYRVDSKDDTTPAQATPWALDLNGRLTGPMLALWYQWESEPYGTGQGGTGCFPPVSTAEDGFLEACQTLLNNNIYITPYIDPFVWDTALDSFMLEARPYACENPDGSVTTFMDSVWAVMDSGTDWWTNYVKNVVKEFVQKYPVPGIYLDQSGTFFSVNFNPSHGNPLGYCENQVAQERNHLNEIITEARTVNPDLMFWGESSSEFTMDILDAKLVHYNLHKNYLPLFPAVYHEYCPCYGRNQELIERFAGDPEPEMQAAWMWMMGYQIGRIWPKTTGYGNPNQQEMLGYIDKLNVLRSTAKQYLIFGKMMRPPYIDPSSIPELTADIGSAGPAVLPGILASMWQSPQGRLALAITNITDSSQTVTIRIDLDEYNFQNIANYNLHDYSTQTLVASGSDRNFVFSLNINSLDAKVLEFRLATKERIH